ncbi:MAG: DUF5723 family protein [Flavobacteriaceae bacterium]|nr:DUF5723 family protein [Flavobacteriaceae bacterium]
MMKLPFLLLFLMLFLSTSVIAQNKQFLYGFKEIPQSLLENPGGEVSFSKHIGIPFLSGAFVNVGTSNSLISNLFANDGLDIEDKLRSILFRLNSRDFVSINEQLDIINIGFKLKNDKDYLSFGFYQEFDLISYYPKDLAVLFYQGNTDGNGNIDLNKSQNINDISFKSEIIGVFHAGISREINKELSIGARVKIYSGAFNIQSLNNKGSISTRLDQNSDYQHLLNDVDVTFNSSGFIGTSNKDFVVDAVKNILFGGNLGLGFDVGFTYHLKDNMTLLGSLLDIGFITYSKDVVTYKINGDVEINDIGLINPPADETLDYWDVISDDIYPQIPIDTLQSTYVSFRSPKMNTALQYKFGKHYRQAACSSSSYSPQRGYLNEVGIQLYTIFRPKQPQLATTLYYSRSVTNFLKAKITYTADSHSFSNIGLGFSTQIGKFNMYANADNLLSYNDFYNSKRIAFLFGMNLIFDE